MEKKSVLNLFSKCIFDGTLYSEIADEKIFSYLPDDFKYEANEGASKLVIIPEDADFVIKIPFTGMMDEDRYKPYVSANNTDTFFWDYCFSEMLTYKHAKAENVHQAFAKESLVGMINEHPIYIQQRVEIYSCSDKYDSASYAERKRIIKYCKKKKINLFNEATFSWQVDALEYYGEKQFNKIMDFIKNNNIGDLHLDNLGYIDNRPVLCDFSNFFF